MAPINNELARRHAANLEAAVAALARAPVPGARDLYQITGLKPGGGFAATQENTLVEVTEFLAGTERVFAMGGGICLEARWGNGARELLPLTEGGAVVAGAEHRLANLMVCAADGGGEFAVPKWFADLLLRSETLRDKLPEVRTYARRPVFDADLVFRGPGWHPASGVLVHGPAVDPLPWRTPAPGLPAVDRLPPRLRELLSGFCFKTDADLANFVGFLLTALLVGRYVEPGKPIALVNGNQPGVGKSLLSRIVGVLMDGSDPPLVPFTANEEELHKTIGAHLRTSTGSVLALDNAKVAVGGKVDSPALEALVSGAVLAPRILGRSELAQRPNDVVWLLTMNDTKASDDLVRRGLPICLEYEGDPANRSFGPDPVKCARRHRVELLGELAGMVDHWTAEGRPEGAGSHRFTEWAREVGGIMGACGFPEFLTNLGAAAAEFSAAGDDLTALAEHVLAKGASSGGRAGAELTAQQWVPLFEGAKVLEDELAAARSAKSKATLVGQFFARAVGKAVAATHKGRAVPLTLRTKKARGNAKVYFFDREDAGPEAPGPAPPVGPADAVQPPPCVPGAFARAGTPGGNDESW